MDLGWRSFGSCHGPPGSHLPTMPLTEVTLVTPSPCPFLTHIPTPILNFLPTISCQTWFFLPATLDFEASTHILISCHLTGFHHSVHIHLDLNLGSCPETMSLSTDVILTFPWSSTSVVRVVVRDKIPPQAFHLTTVPSCPRKKPLALV